MDSYIAQQIVVWMLAAAVVGFGIGWIARGRRQPKARNPMRRLRSSESPSSLSEERRRPRVGRRTG